MALFLSIIGLIIKIIGIILLAVLLLVLLLLFIILFIPIRYELSGKRKDELVLKGSVTWFFKKFGVRFNIDDSDSKFDILLPAFLKKLLSEDEFDEKNTDSGDEYDDFVDYGSIDKPVKCKSEVENEQNKKLQISTSEKTEPKKTDINVENDAVKRNDEQNKDYDRFINLDLSVVRQWFANKLKSIKKFVVYLRKNTDKLKQFNDRFDIKLLIKTTLLLMKKLFSSLGLQLFEFCGIIGFEEPSLTGLAVGTFAAVSPIFPGKAELKGNFTSKELSFDTRLKGRVIPACIIVPVVIYIFTKPVWPVVKFFMRGDSCE